MLPFRDSRIDLDCINGPRKFVSVRITQKKRVE